jgi:hypothetical protein
LKVSEAVSIATEWVDNYAVRNPDFRGAHFMGGITAMSADALFPPESDVDISVLVQHDSPGHDPIDEFYRGVSVEAGLRSVAEYASAERVLTNPEVADHVALNALIADPTGMLASIQPTVAREFAQRRWVMARCDVEKRRFEMYLDAARQAQTPSEFMIHVTLAIQNLAALIDVALLSPPTHRKSLVHLRVQLKGLNRAELAERALAVYGDVTMSTDRVQMYADLAADAFDRALQVKRTASPFDFKLRPHLRPYLVDGSQAMINQGDHREAMPWIGAGIWISVAAILNDAPENEHPRYQHLLDDLLEDLGIASAASRAERLRELVDLGNALFTLADEVVASRPDSLVKA